jgi:MFS transporter, AAHS family, 4-hydroxybenzoate transporter
MDRFNPTRVIAVCYALTAISVYCVGQAVGNLSLLAPIVFLAGVLVNTAQSSMPALAAGFYPTEGRSTGVGWMFGIGRFGGIAGSFLVAELARQQFTFAGIFTVVAIAGGIACAALLVKQTAHPLPAIGGGGESAARRPAETDGIQPYASDFSAGKQETS